MSLSENRLTGEVPPELGNLTSLKELYLRKNNLTGQLPSELSKLSTFTYVDLSDNRFTGCVPDGLRHLGEPDVLGGTSFCENTTSDG